MQSQAPEALPCVIEAAMVSLGSEMSEEFAVRRFVVVPHTHWDREWYRPFEHFRLELGRVVDGVLDVLEGDPEFPSFTLDGQAIVLEDYVEVRPENEARLRALLDAPAGSRWARATCFPTSCWSVPSRWSATC